ncbi:MAG: type VI secretion system contractile sheath large subunit [Phycisphaerales bacterium]
MASERDGAGAAQSASQPTSTAAAQPVAAKSPTLLAKFPDPDDQRVVLEGIDAVRRFDPVGGASKAKFKSRAEAALKKIDSQIQAVLLDCVATEEFKRFEGAWRGLDFLVQRLPRHEKIELHLNSQTRESLIDGLLEGVSSKAAMEESEGFRRVWQRRLGAFNGDPFSSLILGHEFDLRNREHVDAVTVAARIGEACLCPVVANASPTTFGKKTWADVAAGGPYDQLLNSDRFIALKDFRKSPAARFLSLGAGAVMARAPWSETERGQKSRTLEINELPQNATGRLDRVPEESCCWMRPSYALGERLANSFVENGICCAFLGEMNGGMLDGLPYVLHQKTSGAEVKYGPGPDGWSDTKLEWMLANLGFLPLMFRENTRTMVFYSGQSMYRPPEYIEHDKNVAAKLSCRMQHLMPVTRVSQALVRRGQQYVQSQKSAQEVKVALESWINGNFVSPEGSPSDVKRKKPFKSANISVEQDAGRYFLKVELCPHEMIDSIQATVELVSGSARS